MAFLSGNTYIDGDLIVKGNVEVDTISSTGVKFAQLVDSSDGYIALTTSSGNLKKSTIHENTSDGVTTYTLGSTSSISLPSKPLTITSSAVTINTPVDQITATGNIGSLTWVYADGTTSTASSNPSGAKPNTSNPVEYPVGVKLV